MAVLRCLLRPDMHYSVSKKQNLTVTRVEGRNWGA